jgi:hypothetical protein
MIKEIKIWSEECRTFEEAMGVDLTALIPNVGIFMTTGKMIWKLSCFYEEWK